MIQACAMFEEAAREHASRARGFVARQARAVLHAIRLEILRVAAMARRTEHESMGATALNLIRIVWTRWIERPVRIAAEFLDDVSEKGINEMKTNLQFARERESGSTRNIARCFALISWKRCTRRMDRRIRKPIVYVVVFMLAGVIGLQGCGSSPPDEAPIDAYNRIAGYVESRQWDLLFAALDPMSQERISILNQAAKDAEDSVALESRNPYIRDEYGRSRHRTDSQLFAFLATKNRGVRKFFKQESVTVEEQSSGDAVFSASDPGDENGKPFKIVLVALDGEWRLSLIESATATSESARE